MSAQDVESPLEGIAVVGLAGRFPGADDPAELWRNLCGGVESITFYSREELAAAGVDPALLDDPRYVRASGALRDVQHFDAAFFGFSPREAELMDPQHRIFLECCWEALENAGYDTASYDGTVGVFGGMGMSSYLLVWPGDRIIRQQPHPIEHRADGGCGCIRDAVRGGRESVAPRGALVWYRGKSAQ